MPQINIMITISHDDTLSTDIDTLLAFVHRIKDDVEDRMDNLLEGEDGGYSCNVKLQERPIIVPAAFNRSEAILFESDKCYLAIKENHWMRLDLVADGDIKSLEWALKNEGFIE